MSGYVHHRCACGAEYSLDGWLAAPWVGLQDDACGGQLALRNCVCGSTMARPVSLDGRGRGGRAVMWLPVLWGRIYRGRWYVVLAGGRAGSGLCWADAVRAAKESGT